MGDVAVDVFLETLKQLIMSPQLDSFREEKHQLQALEEEVKYLRGFLKATEKERYEHSEVMKLVMQIRDLVDHAENIIEGILIDALNSGKHFTRDALLRVCSKEIERVLKLERVLFKIERVQEKVKQIYDQNIYNIKGIAEKKQSSARSGETEREMGDTAVDFSKQLITSSKLDPFREEKHQLQAREEEIKREMGDTAVDFFLVTLKQLITSSKLDRFREEKHQLQALEEEIKYLRGFLKVTEKKRNEHSEVMKLVIQIRDLVSEAENITEGILIDALKGKRLSHDLPEDHFGGFIACPFRRFRIIDEDTKVESFTDFLRLNAKEEPVVLVKVVFRELKWWIKKKMETITTKVKQIYDQNIYDIKGIAEKKHSSARSGGGSGSPGGINTAKVVKEKKLVVGFDNEVKTLLHKLDEGKPLEIITIIGAGGSGKTTLAREVYDHPYTSHIFEIRAWVDVSQDYDKTTMKRNLLIRVLKSAFPKKVEDYEKSSEDMLGEEVLRCLKGRKYLIVMDDIWDIEAWNDIQRSCPNESNGSKVLFTSRRRVQFDGVRFVSHNLDPLPKDKSWELLQMKVFGMKSCPQELVDIGVKIADKCDGLPLAIVAIAGILGKEDKTLDVWEEVAKHLSSIIAKNPEAGCMKILELSYNHLPLHLKACFLYIGAFLEDSEIRVRELLWLWMAEGFIQQSEGGESLEAVAKDYLIGLIDRSLVMVARKSSLGGIKACRIHDLLRVFCLKKAKEDNFFVRSCEGDTFSLSTTDKHRRFFIDNHHFFRNFENIFKTFSSDMYATREYLQNLQSFLCLHLPNSSYSEFKEELFLLLFTAFERLRVLSFVSAECQRETGIRNLVLLRYLAVRLPRQERFIASPLISNLLNLETLNLQVWGYSNFIQLSRDIFKMVKLRHLYSKYGVFEYHFCVEEAVRIDFDLSKLDSLQTLHRLCACMDCRSFLVRTPNLRKLGLKQNEKLSDDSFMSLNLEFLKCLETLSISGVILTDCQKLPRTIKRLTLAATFLKWEEVSILQKLPSLEVLKLECNACKGPVWNTSEEGFSQLKYLSFDEMDDFKEWNASEDQFPRLEFLVLENCRKLDRIPFDFADLNELREIRLLLCSWSLEESAREIQEEQRNKKGDDDCLNLIAKSNGWVWNDDTNEFSWRSE